MVSNTDWIAVLSPASYRHCEDVEFEAYVSDLIRVPIIKIADYSAPNGRAYIVLGDEHFQTLALPPLEDNKNKYPPKLITIYGYN